jgi:hypothetical protein
MIFSSPCLSFSLLFLVVKGRLIVSSIKITDFKEESGYKKQSESDDDERHGVGFGSQYLPLWLGLARLENSKSIYYVIWA